MMAKPLDAPEAFGLKLALPAASSSTPKKPMPRPRMRKPLGRSLSHIHAMSAPNIGTVAFRIDDSPVVIDKIAYEKQANGIAEFKRPTKNVSFQCWRKPGKCPLSASRGSKNKVATSTRSPAVGIAPNSRAPKSVNRNEAPQIAARHTKSRSHGFCAVTGVDIDGLETEAVKTDRVKTVTVRRGLLIVLCCLTNYRQTRSLQG